MAKQLGLSEVKLKSVNLRSPSWNAGGRYDLLPHLRELNIYESIFSNSLTANITLDEAVNLPARIPIVGEERIEIDIASPGMGDTFDDGTPIFNPLVMFVHKTVNQQLKTPQSQHFSLELVSEQYLSNAHSRISKSYKGMSYRDIAFDIWMNYLNPITKQMLGGIFEHTEGRDRQCVIPNWTPYQAINWLAKRSNSLKYPKAANYVYYETLTGNFFRSLDSLMGAESKHLIFTLEPGKVDAYKSDRFSGGIVPCEAIDIAHKPELIKNINRGAYCSKLITHDIVKKQIRQVDYSLQESWKDTEHLNSSPPINFQKKPLNAANQKNKSFAPPFGSEGYIVGGNGIGSVNQFSDSLVMFAPKHDQLFSENPGHKFDNNVEEWKLQRNSQMTLFDGIKFNVQCGGIPLLRVGMCVDIHMMSPQKRGEYGSDEDKALSGKCMVTAIRHVLTNKLGNTEYKMWLELSKDGSGE
jgi:hypothetical protein